MRHNMLQKKTIGFVPKFSELIPTEFIAIIENTNKLQKYLCEN